MTVELQARITKYTGTPTRMSESLPASSRNHARRTGRDSLLRRTKSCPRSAFSSELQPLERVWPAVREGRCRLPPSTRSRDMFSSSKRWRRKQAATESASGAGHRDASGAQSLRDGPPATEASDGELGGIRRPWEAPLGESWANVISVALSRQAVPASCSCT